MQAHAEIAGSGYADEKFPAEDVSLTSNESAANIDVELDLRAIVERVESIASDILGRDLANAVTSAEVIADAGLSSLMAVEFKKRIGHEINATLPVRILYEFETFAELAEEIYRLTLLSQRTQ
ncbi:acyl carrier protein [Streptomyces anulatus]|uniref:acyl carrier protein n=2 Tax=Actinomycetes TaxID=1760 RepID=UPI0036C1ADB2